MESMQWYVVHVQARQELPAAAAIEQRAGATAYVPEVLQRRRGRLLRVALFPGYLFLAADLAVITPSVIDATPGVVRLVRSEGQPQPIAASVVDALRERVELINAAGGLPTHAFKPGDSVRFRRGPLEGLEAVFVEPMPAAERVRVLLNFLGRQQELRVDPEELEPVRTPVKQAKQERKTRGKGRKIHPS